MPNKRELEEAMRELIQILKQIEEFENKYDELLKKYGEDEQIVTEEDRNDAAIEILRKYSNI